ncbi:MAG: nucleoside 2-deoxyribosyltransferase [Sphaerochaetaceae bacterium]|nr:nucleoside 2-deoxyribosyltransferase [Sphaerochaetaceae bacterium]
MKRKIYFAGSIRGGREDAELYRKMIAFIQQTDTVLTEHIGNPVLHVFEKDKSDAEIYREDTSWLKESDLLIAECTTPSLGVGYELSYAERFNIPCHILYNKGKAHLSAMLSGDNYYSVHPYSSEDEVFEILSDILGRKK